MSKKKDKKKELKKYFNEWEKEVIDNSYYSESTKTFLLNHKKGFYNWNKEALKKGITLKEIKKIEEYLDYFYSETNDGHIIRYYNGFVGAGILEIPEDHKTKGINTIKIFSCGHNTECNDIEIQENMVLTLNETEDLAKCINICIKKFKEINKEI